MSFILEDLIEEIYVAYEALPGGREPLSRNEHGKPQLGNLEKARNAAVGKTVWMFQGGSLGTAITQGTIENPSVYSAGCRFLVWMWVESLEVGWNQMIDLVAAMKATVFAANLGLQNFTIPTEVEGRHMHEGEVYILDVVLSVPLPAVGSVPLELVELQSHESIVTEDNGVADGDGEFTAFETVIVTGPPA